MTTAISTAAADQQRDDYDAFKAVQRERDEILEVTGSLPEDLTGTLYRNGPGRWARDHAVHAFDGDGMITQLILDGSTVRYRNRYVRTPNHQAGGELRGIGTQRPGGPLANALRPPTERANTHAVVHAERLLALADYGRPWELDLDTLETLGPCDFASALSRMSLFSAHPKIDPYTGELFNFGLAPAFRFGLSPKIPAGLRCYRAGRDGRLETLATVPLDRLNINHDFAITERYLVFVIAPLFIDEKRALPALLGLKTYEWAVRWREDVGTKIVLVPRVGGKARVIECPAIPYVHLNNAFEDGDDIVADVVRYADYETFTGFVRDVRDADPAAFTGGNLARLRVTPNDRVVVEDLCTELGELPQHDWRLTSRRYRYAYYTAVPDASGAARILKVDTQTTEHEAHVFAGGALPGEPIFVPRHGDAAEDDGWLLSLVTLPDEDRTALFVLDARRIEAEPVAVARLPHYAFPGFHGSFTKRIAR